MTDQQLTFKDDEIIQILNKVYRNLREGLFQTSIDLLHGALKIESEYPSLIPTLKSAEFWQERQERLDSITDPYQKGEFFISQWKLYIAMAMSIDKVPDRCLVSIKHYVFQGALECYLSVCGISDSGSCGKDPEIMLRIGKCYKVIGIYEKAIECLELASQHDRDNPEILAELADCYSLVNEIRVSKAFFREAFFIDPQKVDLTSIESPMMHRLIAKIKEFGFSATEFVEWIPVYGTILGVFNIKRELRPLELGKLKQSIYALEKMLEENEQEKQHIAPRLINRYIWLIDHFLSTKEDKHKIEETVLKIKEVNPSIYRQYTD